MQWDGSQKARLAKRIAQVATLAFILCIYFGLIVYAVQLLNLGKDTQKDYAALAALTTSALSVVAYKRFQKSGQLDNIVRQLYGACFVIFAFVDLFLLMLLTTHVDGLRSRI